jgi:hypothetical protein
MSELFIWFPTLENQPKGMPNIEENSLVEKYDPKKGVEGMDYDWMDYDFIKNGFPPKSTDHKLPEKLIYVIKKHKELLFDYLNFNGDILIVSDVFLDFLDEKGFKNCYEKASLKVVNKKGEDMINKKNYFAIRIGQFDDNLFDFVEKGKVKLKSLVGKSKDFLYPNMKLKDDSSSKEMFIVNEFCYKGYFIFNENIKKEIMSNFYSPEIYSIKEYPALYKNEFEFDW